MVRLKVWDSIEGYSLLSNFNSTMVRLKESCIASPVMPPCYFNSTMVRLKVSLRHCEYNYYKFQFHYGTIKRELAASTIQKVYNFNSTMVRLKADSLEMWYICKIFQFHYGTIKRNVLLFSRATPS